MVFSADNETVMIPVLLTAVCIFSGATLEEKFQYLHHMSPRAGLKLHIVDSRASESTLFGNRS